MEKKVPVPVVCRTALVSGKGWSIGVSFSTSAGDVLQIVGRAIGCADIASLSLFATELNGPDVELDNATAVLPHAIDWRKRGTKGRFTVKDKEKQLAPQPVVNPLQEAALEPAAKLSRASSSIDAFPGVSIVRSRNASMPSIGLNDDLEEFVREQEAAEQEAAAICKVEASEASFGAPAKMRIQKQTAPPSPVANSAVGALQKRRELERQRSVSAGPRVRERDGVTTTAATVGTGAGADGAAGIAGSANGGDMPAVVAPGDAQATPDASQRIAERENVLMGKKQQIEDMKKQYKQAMLNTTDPTELLRVQERISKVNAALETVSSELTNIRLQRVKSLKRQSSQSRMGLSSSGGVSPRGASSLSSSASGQTALSISPRGRRPAPARVSTFKPVEGVVLVLPEALGSKIRLLWKKWLPGGGDGSSKSIAALFGELVTCPAAPLNVRQLVVQLLDKLCLDNAETMLQTELTVSLVSLLNEKSSDGGLCGAVLALCSKLLGRSEENKSRFVEAGGIFGLLTHLERKRDTDVEQGTALLYSLLQCKSTPAKDSFRAAGGVARAVDLLVDAPPLLTTGILKVLIVLGLTQGEKQMLVSEGIALPPLVGVITNRDSHPMQSIKMAGVLVASLSALSESRQYIANNLSAVSHMLKAADPLLVSNAVRTLGNLALSEEALSSIRKESLASRLVELVEETQHKESLRAMAARCLGNLAFDERILLQNMEACGPEALLEAVKTSAQQMELRGSAVWALVNITQTSPYAETIRRHLSAKDAIGVLVGLLSCAQQSSGEEKLLEALKALSNIALSAPASDVDASAVSSSLIGLVKESLKEEGVSVATGAVSVLVNLSKKNDAFRTALRENGGLELVADHLLPNSDQGLAQMSCNLVTNLCRNGRNRWFFQKNDVVRQRVEELSSSSAVKTKNAAVQAMGNITFPCEDYSEDAAQESGMEPEPGDGSELGQSAVMELIEIAMLEQKEQDEKEEAIDVLNSSAALLNSSMETVAKGEEKGNTETPEFASEEEAREALAELAQKMEEWNHVYKSKIAAHETDLRTTTVALEELELEMELEALASSGDGGTQPLMDKKERFQGEKAKVEKEISELIVDHKIMEERAQARRKQIEGAIAASNGEKAREDPTTKDTKDAEGPEEATTVVRKIDRIPAHEMTKEQALHYHQERVKIAAEMLVSERSYVESLNALIAKYKVPFYAHSLSRKPLFSSNDVDSIFANIEEIVNYHTMFLEGLERRVSKFDRTTCLGQFFSNMTQYLTCYTTYINNYDDASVFLAKLEENAKFKAFLQALVNSPVPGKNMYNYLIMPIQRIPRYIMLIDQLLKHTKSSHPDFEYLQESLQLMEKKMRYIDDLKDIYNRNPHLVALQRRIEGFPQHESLVGVNRTLVKQEQLLVDGREVCVLLFTDAVVTLLPVLAEKARDSMSIYGTLLRKREKEKQPEFDYSFLSIFPTASTELFADKSGTVFSLRTPEGTLTCECEKEDKRTYWLAAFAQALTPANYHCD